MCDLIGNALYLILNRAVFPKLNGDNLSESN